MGLAICWRSQLLPTDTKHPLLAKHVTVRTTVVLKETSVAVVSDYRRQQQLKRGERVDIVAGGAAATFSCGSSSALN